MHIQTFTGYGDTQQAIEEAQREAAQLLESLNRNELHSIQAQLIAMQRSDEFDYQYQHVITVVYE
jgi:hypothetical protein